MSTGGPDAAAEPTTRSRRPLLAGGVAGGAAAALWLTWWLSYWLPYHLPYHLSPGASEWAAAVPLLLMPFVGIPATVVVVAVAFRRAGARSSIVGTLAVLAATWGLVTATERLEQPMSGTWLAVVVGCVAAGYVDLEGRLLDRRPRSV
jgi:hypothetical protein